MRTTPLTRTTSSPRAWSRAESHGGRPSSRRRPEREPHAAIGCAAPPRREPEARRGAAAEVRQGTSTPWTGRHHRRGLRPAALRSVAPSRARSAASTFVIDQPSAASTWRAGQRLRRELARGRAGRRRHTMTSLDQRDGGRGSGLAASRRDGARDRPGPRSPARSVDRPAPAPLAVGRSRAGGDERPTLAAGAAARQHGKPGRPAHRRLSTGVSAASLTRTWCARSAPSCSWWRSHVLLPAPRKPPRMVSGMRPSRPSSRSA